jgi:hypothetical protein
MALKRTSLLPLAASALLIGLGMGACSSENNATTATSGQGGATPSSGAEGANNQGGSNQGGSNQGGSNQGSDKDGDGFKTPEDCNDDNKAINPDAEEICDNGIDDNCNGAIDSAEPDQDGDGFGPCAGDCNDANKDVSPAATEIDGDMVDNNCDGIVDGDFDGDGVTTQDGDCDDTNPDVKPGIKENCFDGIDNNCNMAIDAAEPDADMDGYGPCAGDCDDGNKDINPGAKEIPNNGIDDNCDNLVDADIDGDGWTTQNGDCNDNDPTVNPSVLEVCGDNIDNDCDMVVDTDCLDECTLAELNRSSVGCLYYAIDTNPLQQAQKAVAISNIDKTKSANIKVEVRNGNQWTTISGGATTVGPLGLKTVNFPNRNVTGTAIKTAGAYRISSDLPVIAYQFNPINGASSYLSDASLLLPKSSLDRFYLTPGWPYGRDIGNSLRPAHIQIVATEDNTLVKVTSSALTTPGSAGAPTFQQGVQNSVTLQEGDFLQLTISKENESFAGSNIEANKPISVFTSNDCANVPLGKSNCCCEHLEENIFGLQTWGKSYVAARAPRRGAEQSIWQVTAQENNTNIGFVANGAVTGLPASKTDVLMAGQTKEYSVNGTNAHPGDFVVNADKPILVTQYTVGSFVVSQGGTNGDPSQVQAIATAQFLDRYVVLVPATWVNDYVILVRQIGQTVSLDGALVTSGWTAVGNSAYEVARVTVSDGVHSLEGSAGFGVTVLGWDTYDSYAYPGGLNQKIINPKN